MELFNGLGYIEGITIINIEGEILFTAKFNNKFGVHDENYEIVGKKLLDIYENLTEDTSSIYEAMRKGKPVICDNQELKSKGRDPIQISSISMPIKSGGVIVGAIDLSVTYDGRPIVSDKKDDDVKAFSKRILNSYNKVGRLSHNDEAIYNLDDIITCSPQMLVLKENILKLAKTDFPIMIYGESGTGKELIAHSIHKSSGRADKPFVVQNCGAIPETLIESILFGTSKGAFTGAMDSIGLLELADGGTLFLDEINSMPIEIQPKLLRVVEDGTFRRVGDKSSRKVDVRILSSTNETPKSIVESGKLRADLYYRLAMLQVEIPPLRSRKGDIPLLANYFTEKYGRMIGREISGVSKNALSIMSRYPWRGNVRELENAIAYGMCVMEEGCNELEARHIEARMADAAEGTVATEGIAGGAGNLTGFGEESIDLGQSSLTEMVEAYEKKIIEKALAACGGNVSKAADILSVPRQTLSRKIKAYGIF